ncbi:MAG: hypothetical protein A2010_13360 [Nitrospirae bacterium GWD2_57_9]|nr:MAG: hypothetical protein A2010_13360 [Nitrospirae bacterium GWD2_57_9]
MRGISCTGKVGPCSYIYYYRVVSSEDAEAKTLSISLERVNGISSRTTATFPMRPTITEPVPDAVISLATDTLSLSWQSGEAGDETFLRLSAECGEAIGSGLAS